MKKKILIHSNAPHVKTGYGVQCALLCDRLAEAGYEVAVSCNYGQQGAIGAWITPHGKQVRLYPSGYLDQGNDVITAHAFHWFDGDPEKGIVIPLLDVWALRNPDLDKLQIAAWAPVDHFPVPPGVLAFFERTNATPVAMSRFGERLFTEAGLTPTFVPLAVDTQVLRPRPSITIGDTDVTGRQLYGVPKDAFVVGMVAMNKGWSRDRKGFNEAFRAFGVFWKAHQDAVLLVHADAAGAAEGMDLHELARHCGIPPHALVFTEQYVYRTAGQTQDQMATLYSTFDVMLSPSHGEGFCVPLIEAQSCGTPVIATDFSAQPELLIDNGVTGWTVTGQPEWDPAQRASYVVPFIADVVAKLELAYALDPDERQAMAERCRQFAANYDADRVFEECWLPFLKSFERSKEPLPLERKPMESVDVIVPLVRAANEERLFDSFRATARQGVRILPGGDADKTYAQNVNDCYARSTADFVLVVGDDVEFKPGWFEAAQKLSDRYDVIGTNDSEPGRVRNPDVAAGRHADHFFVRRAYIEKYGASLDGPGVLAPECYQHWWVDKEVIELAKVRNAFTPCLDSVIIHHHPGYDGNEAARANDPLYVKAVASADDDRKTFMSRAPLIQMQRPS